MQEKVLLTSRDSNDDAPGGIGKRKLADGLPIRHRQSLRP